MSVVRTVFLGTPDIAAHCLKALHGDEHFQVVGIVSQPDRPAGRKMQLKASAVKAYAESQGLPVITPEKISDPRAMETVISWGGEVAVVVAYGQILKQQFLDLYPKRIVNIHTSLLPRWRGAAPIQRAIMAGDKETGVCLQIMTRKLDAGDVLGCRKIAIDDQITALDLHEKMKPLAADLLTVDFMDYLRGNLTPVAQDERLVTYAHKIEKSEGLIDWSQTSIEVYNRLRGLQMGPGAHTLRQGSPLKIHKVQLVSDGSSSTPGQVISVDRESFVVACGKGALRILEVQPASRARQTAATYLLGYSMKQGELLG